MKESEEYDIYRHSLLRYLGYANEVGESFRSLVSRSVVNLSYVVATSYCIADAVDKAFKMKKIPGKTNTDVALVAGDVLIWQLLASVAIPGFTINRIARGAGLLVRRLKIKNGKYIPPVVGLASIPVIIHPIDRSVDYLMDNTYRKYLG